MLDEGPMQDATKLATDAAEAVIHIGATFARAFAEAVSGRSQPAVPGETALTSMVRHTSTGIATMAMIAVDAARAGASAGVGGPGGGTSGFAGSENSASPETNGAGVPQAGGGPSVEPGETLRLPLSIDNPGSTTMHGLVPHLTEAVFEGETVPPPQVRFEPASLSIAPRDFEKLVVLIDIPAEAAAGRWRVGLGLEEGGETVTSIAFQVVTQP